MIGSVIPNNSFPVVTTSGLNIGYQNRIVCENLNFEIQAGHFTAIMGANGSGKSTLLKTLLGIIPAVSGEIQVLGASLNQYKSVPWQKIGYVPQRIGTNNGIHASALEVVIGGLLSRRKFFPGKTAKTQAMAALARVGLADRAKDCADFFSGGQQQRLMIARALVRQPQLLFLDEPLSAIDANSRQTLAQILGELKAEGATIVVVLHKTGELTDLIDDVLYLEDSALRYAGSCENLCEIPGTDENGLGIGTALRLFSAEDSLIGNPQQHRFSAVTRPDNTAVKHQKPLPESE